MGRAPRENPSRPSPITRTIHECHEFSRLLRLFEFEENLNLANLIVNGSVDLLKTKDRWIFAGLSSLVNRNRDPRFSSFAKKYFFFSLIRRSNFGTSCSIALHLYCCQKNSFLLAFLPSFRGSRNYIIFIFDLYLSYIYSYIFFYLFILISYIYITLYYI